MNISKTLTLSVALLASLTANATTEKYAFSGSTGTIYANVRNDNCENSYGYFNLIVSEQLIKDSVNPPDLAADTGAFVFVEYSDPCNNIYFLGNKSVKGITYSKAPKNNNKVIDSISASGVINIPNDMYGYGYGPQSANLTFNTQFNRTGGFYSDRTVSKTEYEEPNGLTVKLNTVYDTSTASASVSGNIAFDSVSGLPAVSGIYGYLDNGKNHSVTISH